MLITKNQADSFKVEIKLSCNRELVQVDTMQVFPTLLITMCSMGFEVDFLGKVP